MIQDIFKIVAAVAAIWAASYVSNKIAMWLQAYRSARQVREQTDVKTESQKLNQQANSDSDKLKELDGS